MNEPVAETFYAPLVNNAVRTGLVVANNLEEKHTDSLALCEQWEQKWGLLPC